MPPRPALAQIVPVSGPRKHPKISRCEWFLGDLVILQDYYNSEVILYIDTQFSVMCIMVFMGLIGVQLIESSVVRLGACEN